MWCEVENIRLTVDVVHGRIEHAGDEARRPLLVEGADEVGALGSVQGKQVGPAPRVQVGEVRSRSGRVGNSD